MNRSEILQTAKPILFNTDMVRAIWDNRKTVTRRVIKPRYHKDEGRFQICTNKATGERWVEKTDWDEASFDNPRYVKPPYNPGDILYVRETFCWCPCWDCGMDTEKGCCDKSANRFYDHEKREYGCYGYKASFEGNEQPFDKWHPSIHMPKEAARIFLRVTDVRVERLQDITDEQAEEEGFVFTPPCLHQVSEESYCDLDGPCTSKIKYCDMGAGELFGKMLWNSTIPKKDMDRYGWDANPWVWVIEFERVEVEIKEREGYK